MVVTPEQLGNLKEMGWKDVTVSDLISKLAGMPPMMEVFVNADGTSMFLNEVQIEQPEVREDGTADPPFLRIVASVTPAPPKLPDTRTVQEQTAAKAQQAMELTAVADEATRMPRIVE